MSSFASESVFEPGFIEKKFDYFEKKISFAESLRDNGYSNLYESCRVHLDLSEAALFLTTIIDAARQVEFPNAPKALRAKSMFKRVCAIQSERY
jgi:hypothetical protein